MADSLLSVTYGWPPSCFSSIDLHSTRLRGMKCDPPRPLFSSKGSLHAKNSENREWPGSVHTQRSDRNIGGYQAAPTTACRRDIWAAGDFGSEGRDARQPGCRQISPPLRGRWHPARKLPSPCPKVDRSSSRSNQATTGMTKGFLGH